MKKSAGRRLRRDEARVNLRADSKVKQRLDANRHKPYNKPQEVN